MKNKLCILNVPKKDILNFLILKKDKNGVFKFNQVTDLPEDVEVIDINYNFGTETFAFKLYSEEFCALDVGFQISYLPYNIKQINFIEKDK